jgi:hypothetical protein
VKAKKASRLRGAFCYKFPFTILRRCPIHIGFNIIKCGN